MWAEWHHNPEITQKNSKQERHPGRVGGHGLVQLIGNLNPTGDDEDYLVPLIRYSSLPLWLVLFRLFYLKGT